jgi:hypothetical protein
VSRFITRKLKLKVNEAKSSVTQPGYTKYLGFGFTISKTNPNATVAQALPVAYFTRKLGLVLPG